MGEYKAADRVDNTGQMPLNSCQCAKLGFGHITQRCAGAAPCNNNRRLNGR